MGFFSQLFKPREIKEVLVADLGSFKLVYSKKGRHLWTAELNGIHISVLGSEEAPNRLQTDFLKNLDREIKSLDATITKKFKHEFKEAGQPVNFNDWRERFKLDGVEIMMMHQGQAYWGLEFADQQSPYAVFTLFFEGSKATDFSIDT